MSPASSRSRFLLKVVASQIAIIHLSPTKQWNCGGAQSGSPSAR